MRLVFFVFLGLLSISAPLKALDIQHNPPREFASNEPIVLRLKITDLADYEIKCFYKFNDAEEYSVVELDKIGRRLFKTEIFPEDDANNIKYYFWVYKDNQFLQTLPKNNAVSIPFSILNTRSELAYFTILSPFITKQKLPYEKQMMFVLRNNFPNAVTFKSATLNNDEPLKIISKKKILVNLQSSFPIRQGKNRLEIIGYLKDGTQIKQKFEFVTGKIKKKKLYKKETEVRLNNVFYKTNNSQSLQDESELLYSVRHNLETNSFFLDAYGLYDNRGSQYTQPYSRIKTDLIDKKFRWKIKAGDIEENFSPLTVNGRRFRGFYTDIDLLKFFNMKESLSLRYINGLSNHAIDVSSPNVTIPTYKQEIKGYQLQFSTMKIKSSLQYLKIYDNPSSIQEESRELISPIENHVAGAFLQIRPTPLSYIENEFVIAAYYSDNQASLISIEELSVDSKYKDLINKYLPVKSSLTGGYSNRFTIQVPLLTRHNILKLGHDYTHPNFHNDLNSFIEPDKQELSIELTQKIFNRKLMLNYAYETEQDNLTKLSSDTSHTNAYRINSLYRTNSFGSLSATGMITRKTETVTTSNEDLDNQLNYIMIGMSGIPLNSKIGKVYTNVSYSISDYLDYITAINNSKSYTLNSSLSANTRDYKVAFGLTQSKTSSSLSGISRYLTVFTRVSRNLSKSLKINSKLKFTIGKNNSDTNKFNSRKITNTWNLIYKKKKLKFFKESYTQLGLELVYMTDDLNADQESSNFKEGYTTFSITNKF